MSDDKKKRKDREEEGPRLTTTQRAFLGFLVVLLVGSIFGRVATGKQSGTTATVQNSDGSIPDLAQGLVSPSARSPEADTTVTEEPSALESFLPYLTEGSFFALMGFAVGYTTRKIVKILLIVVALLFIGAQLLSSGGLADFDWGGIIGSLNGLIFNLKENQTVTEILTDRVPTSGAFLLGVVLGFKRG